MAKVIGYIVHLGSVVDKEYHVDPSVVIYANDELVGIHALAYAATKAMDNPDQKVTLEIVAGQ